MSVGVDFAQYMHARIARLRDLGRGTTIQEKTHRQQPPGVSLDITGPDALTQLASLKDRTGHAHMVKVVMNGFDIPHNAVPRVTRLRHGAQLDSKGEWVVPIDPDQYTYPHLSTDRSLQHRQWWHGLRIPMNASEIGAFFGSLVQTGIDMGHHMSHVFLFNLQDLNHHLMNGWDQSISGLARWIHILWRALIVGLFLYGLSWMGPLLGMLRQMLTYLWDLVRSLVGVVDEVVSWFVDVLESLVSIFTGAQ